MHLDAEERNEIDIPITSRLYFVEGVGQLCRECYHKLWAREEEILPEGERKQMIKTITVPTWPDIEQRIAALPEEQKKKYEGLKEAYEKETKSSHPNHELIASLMAQANDLLK